MLVRVQSSEGTKRILVEPADTLRSLLDKVRQEFEVGKSTPFSVCTRPGGRGELTPAQLGYQLQHIPIRHGDMLYLLVETTHPVVSTVTEDQVDSLLATRDGKVERSRDPQLCHHGDNNKCVNCMALEPWDEAVQNREGGVIKHLSFHTYLRKLTSGADKGKFANLEDLSCKIKPGCRDHAPWPAGICTKCQPSAITLARQAYRHVDNVMFERGEIVDKFLNEWRGTGGQRVGILLGSYTEYTEVPLGIRAVVSAIYEPPQVSQSNSVELVDDPSSEGVEGLAALLGLKQVGWIFTDLESIGNGRVAYKRSVHSHILSAQECIMAAELQNKHPNICKLSSSGRFGSKFITVCVSGNENNQIDLKGYQVSNQCMALVRDDCLVPTLDAPELGYVRESTPQLYVPDVFYSTKDGYGESKRLARPLPLEYLIIELTTSQPRHPQPLLPGGKGEFPVENRLTAAQDFGALCHYVRQQTGLAFLNYMADFHLLLYLYTQEAAGLRLKDSLGELCVAIKSGDKSAADRWRISEPWTTLEQLIHTSAETQAASVESTDGGWECKHCTLLNLPTARDCEACHLPK